MKLIIVCGNEDCRKEFEVDTGDKFRECPHCGRKSENTLYPFLTAKLMQSKIDGDGADWEAVYDEAYDTAEVKVRERTVRLRRLEGDLDVPVEQRYPDVLPRIEAMRVTGEVERKQWRMRHEELVEGAREIILDQERRIEELERKKDAQKKAREGATDRGEAGG